jgi:hypothetical protein
LIKSFLQSQCVPLDKNLWFIRRADEFWTARRKLLAASFKVAEIDYGGYVEPYNLRIDRVDRRMWQNESDKRRSVVVIREQRRPRK